MSFEDKLTIGLFGFFALLVLLDFARPARIFPKLKWWRVQGLLFFVLYFALATVVPMVVDEHLAAYRLLDLSGLGIGFGAVAGIIVYQFVGYFWHRAMHKFQFLWRYVHQMHHSAERLDIFSAFYFSPWDMIGWTLVGSVSLVFVVGLMPEAAIIANTVIAAVAVLGHSNLKTPRWLGYIIQRPENHTAHHERGVHAYNYGDFSFVDMLFGTFKNPETFDGQTGFYDGASRRFGDMLLGRDVSTPPPGVKSEGETNLTTLHEATGAPPHEAGPSAAHFNDIELAPASQV